MRSKMPGKLGYIVISLVIAMGGINLVFATWEENLDIVGTMQTGEFRVEFIEGYCINYDPPGSEDLKYNKPTETWPFDVGTTKCDVEKNEVTITLENTYPCYQTFVRFRTKNYGTIPAKLKNVTVTFTDPDGLKDYVEFGVCVYVNNGPNYYYPGMLAGTHPRTDAPVDELETGLKDTINRALSGTNGYSYLLPNQELWYDLGFHIKDGAPQKANLTITIETTWTQFNVQ